MHTVTGVRLRLKVNITYEYSQFPFSRRCIGVQCFFGFFFIMGMRCLCVLLCEETFRYLCMYKNNVFHFMLFSVLSVRCFCSVPFFSDQAVGKWKPRNLKGAVATTITCADDDIWWDHFYLDKWYLQLLAFIPFPSTGTVEAPTEAHWQNEFTFRTLGEHPPPGWHRWS